MSSLVFLIAALCAGVMGFAIQRGATCTVAAVEEIVGKGSARRLLSLFEASVWVAGGLLVAQALGVLETMPSGYSLSGFTILGGMLLGLGAFINGACVFGSVARFGSGQWAYVATPVGFYLACLSVGLMYSVPQPITLPDRSQLLRLPAWVAALFLLFVAWRAARPFWGKGHGATSDLLRARVRDALASRIWSPHAATTVIGVIFSFMLLMLGAWGYTDVLAELAAGMAANFPARLLLILTLLLGATWGGWTAGRCCSTRITAGQVLRCFVGGALMGWGSLLIPGSNDGLILVGMPLLWPYAWVAFVTMCLSIGVALLAQKALATPVTDD